MTAIYPNSTVFPNCGLSPTVTHDTHDLPKLPRVDDIDELANQVQERTDILSRLLLNETKWKRSLSPEHHKLLGRAVGQFCAFCDVTVNLLETFSDFSNSFAILFDSIFNKKGQSSIEEMASVLRSQVGSIHNGISSAEQLYANLNAQFEQLMRVAPEKYHRSLNNDHKVFQRLDALWKVVATQLSSVLEFRSGPPSLNDSFNARNTWLEYQGCLLGATGALMQASDTIKGSANGLNSHHDKSGTSLSSYVVKGFNAFWSKLRQRGRTF